MPGPHSDFIPTPWVVDADPRSLTLAWALGPDDGGGPWEYWLQWRSKLGKWVGQICDAPPVRHAGLMPGVAYIFRGAARRKGADKWGPPSAEVAISTPCTFPDKVRHWDVVVEPTQHSVAVRWQPPAADADASETVRRYRTVLRRLGSDNADEPPGWEEPDPSQEQAECDMERYSTATCCSFEGLQAGADYCVFVSGMNRQALWSCFSGAVHFQTRTAVPGAVRAAGVRVHWTEPTAAAFYWAPPPSCGGSVRRYVVQWRKAGAAEISELVTADSSPAATLGNLAPGAQYELRVRAVNDAGDGEFGGWTDFCTPPPPLTTDIQLEEATQDSLSICWRKLPTVNYCVTHFIVEYRREAAGCAFEQVGIVPLAEGDRESGELSAPYSHTQHPLPPAAPCCFRLRCRSTADGVETISDPGPEAHFETLPAWPGQAPRPRVACGDPLTLEWDAAAARGAPVSGYQCRLMLKGSDAALLSADVAERCWAVPCGELEPGRFYCAVVRARSALGHGAWSPRLELRWDGGRAAECTGRASPVRGTKGLLHPPSRVQRMI